MLAYSNATARHTTPVPALATAGKRASYRAPPPGLILFCGMSIGFEVPVACHDRIDRAPLAETVTFVDG
ncbi:hypothetical protein [Streptomyces sp. NPDC017529]|uniref:hypothetical protein n=1 Tax=Streptomyces sp. NPDC017529 TaxID=3365000 RepID=UPI003787ABF9